MTATQQRLLSFILFFFITITTSINAYASPAFFNTPASSGRWLVGAGGGIEWLTLGNKTNTLINNIGGNPADVFTVTSGTQSAGLQEVFLGYRWHLSNSRYFSLKLDYEHFNQTDVNEQRIPLGFSASASTDTYQIDHQALLLLGQFDLLKWRSLMPFVQGGIGFSKSTFSNFYDANVFTMPTFPNASQYDFSYLVGAGLDWKVTRHVLISLGYRFGWWGDMKSGSVDTVTGGSALPSPIHLTHTLRSQQVFATLTYLFRGDRG